jgi:hypothetical protein
MIDLNIIYFYRKILDKSLEELIAIYKDLSASNNEEKRVFYSIRLVSYDFFEIWNKIDELTLRLKELGLYSDTIAKIITETKPEYNESLYDSK